MSDELKDFKTRQNLLALANKMELDADNIDATWLKNWSIVPKEALERIKYLEAENRVLIKWISAEKLNQAVQFLKQENNEAN